jgi:hypothetical protein
MFFEYMRSLVLLTIRHSHLRVLIGIFIVYGLCAFQELFRVESDSKRLSWICRWSSLHIIQVFMPNR